MARSAEDGDKTKWPRAILVPNLLPGERALVRIAHVSKSGAGPGSAFGVIMRRHNASPERQIPACAGFGQCGGCTVQHLAYEGQLRHKREQVVEALAQLGANREVSERTPLYVEPCVPSPTPLEYRSRVKLVPTGAEPSGGTSAGQGPPRIILGAYAPRSHRVLDMAGCKVNAPTLRLLARALATHLSAAGVSLYDEESGRGALRHVLLRQVRSGAVQLSLVFATPPPRAPLLAVVAELGASFPQLASVVLHHNDRPGNALLGPVDQRTPSTPSAATESDAEDSELGTTDEVLLGPDFLYEDLGEPGSSLELSVRVSARSFMQVNRAVASRIYADIASALPVRKSETLVDLYCGVGGLGRTVQLAAHKSGEAVALIGIESNPVAIADAQASAHAAGLSPAQARFVCGAVEAILPGLLAAPGSAETTATPALRETVVLLNPPRRGCTKEVLAAIVAGAPRAIAYVSCNVQSLARDLGVLSDSGYRVTKITPYDMHPGTPHVETVVLLDRVSAYV